MNNITVTSWALYILMLLIYILYNYFNMYMENMFLILFKDLFKYFIFSVVLLKMGG